MIRLLQVPGCSGAELLAGRLTELLTAGDDVAVERAVMTDEAQRPPSIVVLLGWATTADGPSSCCTWPCMNFHIGHGYAVAYLADHPELAGQIVDQVAAVEIAGRTFGPLVATA